MPQSSAGIGTPSAPTAQQLPPWSNVNFSPPEDWVDMLERGSAPASPGAHITHLLWSRQHHAERATSFFDVSTRLETTVAVQHESQWKLSLQPRTQTLTLHWLRVIRGDKKINHLHRDRVRLIQREASLEELVIDGAWTLLVVLDDVRPGDIVEAGYSYKTNNPIRPDGAEAYFSIPSTVTIAKYHLSVRFAPHRPLRWQASADAAQHVESVVPEGLKKWTWEGAQLEPRELEKNTPANFPDYINVQVSDLENWNALAATVHQSWNASISEPDKLDDAFPRPRSVNADAVVRLIQTIQDNYRYLSLDLEAGGWTPASPFTVIQRRYGDCKDLAWLAANVLNRWGVFADVVLVNSHFREKILDLPPMQSLFNHAIVQVEIEQQTRWFDLTHRAQGGNFSTMPVSHYGAGLVVSPKTAGLETQPGPAAPTLYALRETLYIDTRKSCPSAVEIRVRAEGWQAENLRRARLHAGEVNFERDRTAAARDRFGKVKRIGEMQWRDRREENICEIVEAFEIQDCLRSISNDPRVALYLPPSLVHTLTLPEDRKRRTPWAVPFPLVVRHEVRVRVLSLRPGRDSRKKWSEPELAATTEQPCGRQRWSTIVRFSTEKPSVDRQRLLLYRKSLESLLKASTWHLYLSQGDARPAFDNGFGQLPAVEEGVAAYVPSADDSAFPELHRARDPSIMPKPQFVTHSPRRRKKSYRKLKNALKVTFPIFVIVVVSIVLRSCIDPAAR